MGHCLTLGIDLPSLWRASTSALVKKINDLCFSLPSQRLISNELNIGDDDATPESLYMKRLISYIDSQSLSLIPLTEAIYTYFNIIRTQPNLTCQLLPGDSRDILRFII